MKYLLVLAVCLLISNSAFTISNFNYMGYETNKSFQKLNNIYPPMPRDIIEEVNNLNIAALTDTVLGDLYESHGCIHISPATAKIMYQIIKDKTPVNIMKYTDKVAEKESRLPWVSELINHQNELKKINLHKNEIKLYPDKIGILFNDNKPIAKFNITNGPQLANYPLTGINENGQLIFDENHATRTPPGKYTTFKKTTHFYAPAYPETSLIKQGGEIKKINGTWHYYDENNKLWQKMPEKMADELDMKNKKRTLLFYDIERDSRGNAYAAKWGGHPFGNVSFLLMNEKGIVTSILIHTNGELLLEEKELAHYIAEMSALSPEISWEEYVSSNRGLLQKKFIADFIDNPFSPDFEPTSSTVMYKLANNLTISANEKNMIEGFYYPAQRFYSAYKKGQDFVLTNEEKRVLNKYRITPYPKMENTFFAIYADIKTLDVGMKKTYKWYKGLQQIFKQLNPLRKELNKYYSENDIMFEKEKYKIAYCLINSRLQYKNATSLDLWLKNKSCSE